ncbi:putative pupal cuticle protein Edg-84A-like 4 [Homarus americanus]|uniref:Putative pupal cuticle protein Edg-84A-like 4 n=1 Tax=Homarus americanus TaxID=6706 RepID=A0A8J5JTS9_HOMAM|nr:putative pupal cuticle protein Edg-84A-like 4 [Homarus americanus]
MFLKVIAALVMIAVGAVLSSPDVYEPTYYPAPIPYYFDYNVYDAYGGSHRRTEHSDGYSSHGQYDVYYPGGSTASRKY